MHVDKNILGHEVAWEEDSSVGTPNLFAHIFT